MVARKGIFLSIITLSIVLTPLSTMSEGTNFHWLFQQLTYLLGKDTPDLKTYNCDLSKDACKVNFDFTPSIPTDEPSSHYTCLIDFGFGTTGEEGKCNPGTVEFPVGSWNVHLIIKKIADDSVVVDGSVTIVHPDGSIDPLRVTQTKEWQSPTYLLGKEDSQLSEYTCDPTQPECKINLLISPLLDGVVSPLLTCDITSDFTLVPTTDSCNPNTSIVPTGNHILTIKILDKNKNSLLQTYTLTLKNPAIDTTIDPTKVVTDIAWQQPTYLLEKDDTSRNEYTCDPTKTECKMNLLVTPKLDGVESPRLSCRITTDFGVEENDCNPDTFSVPTGEHFLLLETKNKQTYETITTRKIVIHGLSTGSGGGTTGNPLDLNSVKILVQSGLDETFTCKTEMCQVNLSAEVPAGVVCSWDFGTGTFETLGTDKKCNPGYVKFASDASVKLIVTDPKSSNTITKILEIHRTKDIILAETILARIDLQTKLSATKKLTNTGISCIVGRSKKCSINFTGESSVGAKTWHWDFGDGTAADKENPGSHSFPIGKYQVSLVVSNGVKSHTATYAVDVISETEKEPCTTCQNMVGKIQISAVLPNPPHADTVEWIELKNISDETFSLDACQIEDDTDSFDLFGNLGPGKTLRLRQASTGLTLGNTHDSLKLNCGDTLVDTFSWDFPIPTSYILRRDVLYPTPVQTTVTNVVDGDTVDVVIEGKKMRVRLLGIDTPETVHPRKPIEKFGKEASDYTKKTLEGKTVWLTFDVNPVDLYGRRLAYIWQCSSAFSESTCTLFNAQVVSQGYGRMERRFEFRLYYAFDDLEKKAKAAKLGIWSDPEVAQEMNNRGQDEENSLQNEQEKEYLKLQEDLLKECESDGILCEKKKIKWNEITEKMSTLLVSQKQSGIVRISGRTWGNFPVGIEIYRGEELKQKLSLQTDDAGEYYTNWIPKIIGEYRFVAFFQKDDDTVKKEKQISILSISPHLSVPLEAHIMLQGQMTDNRWLDDHVFHCRSRGSCSVNLVAETNRDSDVNYLWTLPDGTTLTSKNPPAIKLTYGQYDIRLRVIDDITGEILEDTLHVDHQPIPKKPKKSSTKYTLDFKDVPQDIGGGVIPEEKSPLRKLGGGLLILVIISSLSLFITRKHS